MKQTYVETGQRKGAGMALSLLGLVLAAVAPLLIFGFELAKVTVDEKRTEITTQLQGTARGLRVAVDQVLLGHFESMATLATDASLDRGDLKAFEERAYRARQALGDWISVALLDPHSRRLLVSAPAAPMPAPVSVAPAAVDQVAHSMKPMVVGVFASGRVSPRPMVLLLSPVMRGGGVIYVLGVALSTDSINSLFATQGLPASWTGAVLDQGLTIAGRSRDPERFVGVRATSSLAERIAGQDSGMFTALNQEGAKVYTVFNRSPKTGWVVPIGIPAAEVEGPIAERLSQITTHAVALISLALLLTLAVGYGIARRRDAYELALRESERHMHRALSQFQDLVSRIPIGVSRFVLGKDQQRRFDFVSDKWCRQLGVTAEQAYANADVLLDRLHADDRTEHQRLFDEARYHLRKFEWEGQVHGPAGTTWLRIEAQPELMPNNDIIWNTIQFDVTEQREASERQRLATRIFEMTRDAVLVTDARANILAVNPSFVRTTGYEEVQVLGRNPSILSSGKQGPAFYAALWQALQTRHHWSGEIWNRRANGDVHSAWLNITALLDGAGKVSHYIASYDDLTEIKRAQEAAERMAWRDPLTGLANRALFLRDLEVTIANAPREGGRTDALLLIDLDRFKAINDARGMVAGDALLRGVAERLQACLHPEDGFARLGSDEFAVLLPRLASDRESAAREALALAEKLRSALREPLMVDDDAVHLDCSVGVALFPGPDPESAIDLMRQADVALQEGKAHGGACTRFFEHQMGESIRASYQLERALHLALHTDQLRLYLQPQVDAEGRQVGAEALLRWSHPEQGLLQPGVFIPVAEGSDLIVEVGDWVLREVCRLQADLGRQGATLPIAVNVSPRQFRKADFVPKIRALLSEFGLAPEGLTLEITEAVLIDDLDNVVKKMHELRQLGLTLSLDDFGTGYSSLAYLRQMPIQELKIDKSFVEDLRSATTGSALVEAILAVAHHMHLKVIAEGVETPEQAAYFSARSHVTMQGYLYSTPLPLADWLARRTLRLPLQATFSP